MSPEATLFTWMGDQFIPASAHWQKRADKLFTIGQRYALVEEQERSSASHRAYFASVNEAWRNLPDSLAERFTSADHLRRYALITKGFCTSQDVVCATRAEAVRWAKIAQQMDEYAVVEVRGSVVTIHRAKSQSYRAMPAGEFQKSKEAVLGVLSELIGVTPRELTENTEKAA